MPSWDEFDYHQCNSKHYYEIAYRQEWGKLRDALTANQIIIALDLERKKPERKYHREYISAVVP
jgi:hypothetical protein